MSTPINANMSGTFSTDATPTPVVLSLPPGATEIEIVNLTDYNTPAATIIKARGFSSSAAGHAQLSTGNGATPNVLAESVILTNGFTFFNDSADQTPGPAIVNAAGGITNAAPPVVTSATLYPVGSTIRLSNTTAALQLAGMDYTVTVSGAGTMTLGHVATAPGSAATANTLRLVNANSRFYPRSRYITGITAAAQAVIALSVTHGFTVGQKVRISVPQGWGMTQLNGTLATIVAIGTAFGGAGTTNTITVDVDTSAMTAFAYPTSATAATGVGFPQVAPVGEDAVQPYANLLDDATRNISSTGVIIGSGALVASKNYSWIAKRSLSV